MEWSFLGESPDGAILAVFVQPRASRNEIRGAQGDELRVRLTSPPVDGAANKLCCQYFAKLFRIPKSNVVLLLGDKSRHKRLLLRDLSTDAVRDALAPFLS